MQPVRKELFCDIAIIGGGVGGCAAAIAAARRGRHVIIFEKGVSLGGLATNGYVPQIAGGIEGICLEFTKRLEAEGQLRKLYPDKDYYRNPSFEPEFGKIVLEEMVTQAGARIIYDSTCMDVEMDGPYIKKALLYQGRRGERRRGHIHRRKRRCGSRGHGRRALRGGRRGLCRS